MDYTIASVVIQTACNSKCQALGPRQGTTTYLLVAHRKTFAFRSMQPAPYAWQLPVRPTAQCSLPHGP
jgi:hypothetical protein